MRQILFGSFWIVLVSLITSCASLGDPTEARQRQVQEDNKKMAERAVWLTEERSLEDCLAFALENNYQLRLTALQRHLAHLDVQDALSNLLPQVTISETWRTYRHQPTMQGMNTSDKRYANGTLNVELPILVPAAWLLYGNRRLAQEEGILAEHATRQAILAQVTLLYYQCLLGEVEIQTLDSQVAATKSQYERVHSMLEEGQVLAWEDTIAEAQYRSKEIQLQTARRNLLVTRGRFLQVLGLSPMDAEKLRLARPTGVRPVQEQTTSERVLQALLHRPELTIEDRRVVEAENQVRMAIVDFLPVVGGFLTETWTNDSIADRVNNLFAGFTAALEVFKGFSKVQTYRKTKVAQRAALLKREQLFLSVILEVATAEANLSDAMDNVRLTQLNVNALRARYQEFSDRYEEGVEPLYRMLDARAEMDDAELQFVRTQFICEIADTQLALAMGTIKPDEERQTPEAREFPAAKPVQELLIKE